jgi:hypothetical protein
MNNPNPFIIRNGLLVDADAAITGMLDVGVVSSSAIHAREIKVTQSLYVAGR